MWVCRMCEDYDCFVEDVRQRIVPPICLLYLRELVIVLCLSSSVDCGLGNLFLILIVMIP